MSQRPKAVLLDVNGTLFPVEAAGPVFRDLGLQEGLVKVWFHNVLKDAMAAQMAGTFIPLKDWGAYHIELLLRDHGLQTSMPGPQAMQQLASAWSKADMYPDVVPGLKAMHTAGIKVAVMTNGTAETIVKPLMTAAGMEDIVTPMLDINMAQAWKPHPSSYQYAVSQLGVPPGEVMMIASHPWDTFGAMQAGLRGAYVQRQAAEAWPACLPKEAEYITKDFESLAEELVGLAEGKGLRG